MIGTVPSFRLNHSSIGNEKLWFCVTTRNIGESITVLPGAVAGSTENDKNDKDSEDKEKSLRNKRRKMVL